MSGNKQGARNRKNRSRNIKRDEIRLRKKIQKKINQKNWEKNYFTALFEFQSKFSPKNPLHAKIIFDQFFWGKFFDPIIFFSNFFRNVFSNFRCFCDSFHIPKNAMNK